MTSKQGYIITMSLFLQAMVVGNGRILTRFRLTRWTTTADCFQGRDMLYSYSSTLVIGWPTLASKAGTRDTPYGRKA